MDFENSMIHTSKLTPTKEITSSGNHIINYNSSQDEHQTMQDNPLAQPADIHVDIEQNPSKSDAIKNTEDQQQDLAQH